MNRIFIILLFTFQITNSQVKQTREIRDLFVSSLNIPANTRNMEYATKEIAKRNNLKKIIFLINDSIVGFNEYDRNGNLIVFRLNDYQTKYEYDKEERLISKKHYKDSIGFRDGYIFEYSSNSKLTYRLKNRKVLKNKSTHLEDENIKIITEYNQNGEITSRRIEVFDDTENLIGKTQFFENYESLNTQLHTIYYNKDKIPHELMLSYSENKDFVNQRVTTRQNYIYDEKGNRIKRMYEGFINCEYSYNSKNRITSTTYTSKQNGIWQTVKYKYENDTILKKRLEINLMKDSQKSLEYIYNSEKELKTIIRINGEYSDIFNYTYEYY